MIGQHQPKQAIQTDLKGAILIGVDECTTALEEALQNLTDEQVWSYPLPGRHNIGTIVMHCLENLNGNALWNQVGKSLLDDDERFDMWSHSADELRSLQQNLPGVRQMVEWLRALRAAISEGLETATEEDLRGPRAGSDWYAHHPGRTRADACLRTTMHTMAHIRQVWMLRGVMGLTDKEGWPEQHWA